MYLIIVCSVTLVYFCTWFFHNLFFPDVSDCILSLIWQTNPCTDVDFEVGFSLIYLFGGTIVFALIINFLSNNID
jgi:hypothetical protein